MNVQYLQQGLFVLNPFSFVSTFCVYRYARPSWSALVRCIISECPINIQPPLFFLYVFIVPLDVQIVNAREVDVRNGCGHLVMASSLDGPPYTVILGFRHSYSHLSMWPFLEKRFTYCSYAFTVWPAVFPSVWKAHAHLQCLSWDQDVTLLCFRCNLLGMVQF